MNHPQACDRGALDPPVSDEAWPLEAAFGDPIFVLLHDEEIAYLMNEGIIRAGLSRQERA